MRAIADFSSHCGFARSKVPLSRVAGASASCGGLSPVAASAQASGSIYYWDPPADTVYMLFIYRKTRQSDLTGPQLETLRRLVREELK